MTNNSDPGQASEQPGHIALPPGSTHFLWGPGVSCLAAICRPLLSKPPQVPGVCFMDGSVVSQYDNVSCENFISLHCLQSLCVCVSEHVFLIACALVTGHPWGWGERPRGTRHRLLPSPLVAGRGGVTHRGRSRLQPVVGWLSCGKSLKPVISSWDRLTVGRAAPAAPTLKRCTCLWTSGPSGTLLNSLFRAGDEPVFRTLDLQMGKPREATGPV